MTEPIRIELPTLYGMKTVNAYLFKHPEPVLVDCGEKSEESWTALEMALRNHGLEITDIKRIIITHAHVDHIGMAAKIAAVSGAKVWVNEYCYDWAVHTESTWDRRIGMLEKHFTRDLPPDGGQGDNFKQMMLTFFRAVMQSWDPIPAEQVVTFPIDGQLHFGGCDWEVIYAPGHTNMQTCFYQPDQKWLIGADMLLRITPTPVIEFSLEDYQKRENGLADMLRSFEKIRNMDISTVYPGHYEPFSNHQQIIEFQVNRIRVRIEETYELIKSGKNRFNELFNTLYVNRLSMPGMSMLRGYLDVLMEEDRIEERTVDGYNGYFIKKTANFISNNSYEKT